MEAAMQEGYRRCSCYPGYLRASNNSCQGESLSCFRDVLSDLGQFWNTRLEAPSRVPLSTALKKPRQKYNKEMHISGNITIISGQFRTIIDEGKEKTCMSACVDQTFDVTVSSNSFPSRESFNHRKTFCKVVRKVLHFCTKILIYKT